MGFTIAQYQAALDKVDTGIKKLSVKTGEVMPAAESAASKWYIPKAVGKMILTAAAKLVDGAQWLLGKVGEIIKGALAPVYMFKDAWTWHDIAGQASQISTDVKDEVVEPRISAHWKGDAVEGYVKAIKPQSGAAAQVKNVASQMAESLTIAAGASLAFYVAVGIIIYKFIAELVAAIVAFGTGAFSPAGLALATEAVTTTPGLMGTAWGALTVALGITVEEMVRSHGNLTSNEGFPGGKWPVAVVGLFGDATVRDGDADWSIAT